jgi:valyl-tRNA synthetase
MAADRLKTLEERTRYDPAEVERPVFERWEEAGIFHPEPERSATENYSIAIPPPNVTGALHMGHALNGTLQDVLIRLKRMQGRRTKWIFGTDHAGIATQVKVEEELREQGTSREEIGRDAFVERVWQWREKYGSTIVEQYKRLGASADYEEERFTMDEGYVRAVVHVFVRLFEKGLIYRDNYMVNWDPGTRSAISDLEVEQREVQDTLYMVDYPLESGSGSITVATVRPETMLADTAVAVNPDDERYTRLVGEHAILPLVGRRLPIIADAHVDPDFGTGALKITPGHDPNDFEIGRRHGLEEVTVIGEDGTMTEAAGERFADLTVDEARDAVVDALREEGLVSGTQPYVHDVPHSHRSGRRIEPLISLQWFCDMKQLARPAIDAVEGGFGSTPSVHTRRSTSTGSRTSGPGASRASSGGATAFRSGTATLARRRTWPSPIRSAADRAGGSCAEIPMCSTPGSRRHSGRSRRLAGRTTGRNFGRSIPPTCWSLLATSSSFGSRAW